mmetsp:Transcript_92289/g.275289  ORF Transcript_92289/g.275289 Transcript_92289/m.275289 type:complete len:241 (+) Transcript_92289:181-903(+)
MLARTSQLLRSSAYRLPRFPAFCCPRLFGPLRRGGFAMAAPAENTSSSRPTSRLQDQRGRSQASRWPTPTVRPRSTVRNFRNSRQLPSSCWITETMQRTSLGYTAVAAFCRQYKRLLSRVYHSFSPYSSIPIASSFREPSSSRSLMRHWMTSISGKGGVRSHQLLVPTGAPTSIGVPSPSSGSSGPSGPRSSRCTAAVESSTVRPSWNSGRMWDCEKLISSGDKSLLREAAPPSSVASAA